MAPRLETLKDAGDVLTGKFGTVTAWRTLEIAIVRLMDAATSAKPSDIADATDLIARVLRARHVLASD